MTPAFQGPQSICRVRSPGSRVHTRFAERGASNAGAISECTSRPPYAPPRPRQLAEQGYLRILQCLYERILCIGKNTTEFQFGLTIYYDAIRDCSKQLLPWLKIVSSCSHWRRS